MSQTESQDEEQQIKNQQILIKTQELIERLEAELQGEDEIDNSLERKVLKSGRSNQRKVRNKSAPKEMNTIQDDSSESSVNFSFF